MWSIIFGKIKFHVIFIVWWHLIFITVISWILLFFVTYGQKFISSERLSKFPVLFTTDWRYLWVFFPLDLLMKYEYVTLISFLGRLTKIAFCSIVCLNLQCFLVILLTKFTFFLRPICKIHLQLLAVQIPDSPLKAIGKIWNYFFVTNWTIDFTKKYIIHKVIACLWNNTSILSFIMWDFSSLCNSVYYLKARDSFCKNHNIYIIYIYILKYSILL